MRLRLTRSFCSSVLMDARAAIPLTARVERRSHQHAKTSVGLRVRRLRSTTCGVEAAGRDLQVLTELGDWELGLLRVDPSEDYAWCLAKRAAAFFKMSRSMRSSRLSFRNCASSARSSIVRPVRPFVRSARACQTQLANENGVRSSSRATAPIVLPSSNISRTAPARNSSENCRRTRRPDPCDPILAIVSAFRMMPTESDQAQYRGRAATMGGGVRDFSRKTSSRFLTWTTGSARAAARR
jgi:hypothetical protein